MDQFLSNLLYIPQLVSCLVLFSHLVTGLHVGHEVDDGGEIQQDQRHHEVSVYSQPVALQ